MSPAWRQFILSKCKCKLKFTFHKEVEGHKCPGLMSWAKTTVVRRDNAAHELRRQSSKVPREGGGGVWKKTTFVRLLEQCHSALDVKPSNCGTHTVKVQRGTWVKGILSCIKNSPQSWKVSNPRELSHSVSRSWRKIYHKDSAPEKHWNLKLLQLYCSKCCMCLLTSRKQHLG